MKRQIIACSIFVTTPNTLRGGARFLYHVDAQKTENMKIAFHFDESWKPFKGSSGPFRKAVFKAILENNSPASTKVFIGGLLLKYHSYKKAKTTRDGELRKFDQKKFKKFVGSLLSPENTVWSRLKPNKLETLVYGDVYVICLESIDMRSAQFLHNRLAPKGFYLGALEVDDATPAHWVLYSNSLIPTFRLIGNKASIFHDGFDLDEEDYLDVAAEEELRDAGYRDIAYESLNGKFSIFDKYHGFEHAQRIADWKRRSGGLLAFIADDVVTRLGDTAPQFGTKLWATLQTFEGAETDEQFAQVSASCRRVLEYVTDCIFPPIEGEPTNVFKSGKTHYRNRLLAFADKSRQSNTNIDLICVSTASLRDQLEKLEALINKGVHAEVYRAEARRCILRTIILFDDILSLNPSAFEIKDHLDMEEIKKIVIGEN
ncbi:MAG: hypothetical protein JWO13_734 [Acidobacteriales bacterium]|nr:hypothetical protein [Terriglobales bacterium]